MDLQFSFSLTELSDSQGQMQLQASPHPRVAEAPELGSDALHGGRGTS